MATSNTSTKNRQSVIHQFQSTEFDLLVIGGGATGTGIALDAAARGLKTALIEKKDFASGTSSKSTKLIHGGLRYLKQFDIGLVRETGTERAIVHKLAPHLVLPEKMLMPLIKDGTYGYWSTSFGLWVYDMLADVEGDDRRKMLNKQEALAIEPLLDAKDLKGGGFYAEYRTDDARLTIELMKTAIAKGALGLNYCRAGDFVYDKKGNAEGVVCMDQIFRKKFIIKAKKIVSATGPWVDKVRKKDGKVKGKRLHLSKGVHIVFPHEKIPLQHTIYFDVPDGRMVFAIPRGKTTYVGTTDTTYTGSLNRILTTKSDVDYLLNAVNNAFPSIKVKKKDVISSWAGLRPLIHEDGKSPSELSRKDEIFISDTGLISIAGGKLTGYRKMAERIVDLVVGQLKMKKMDCTTDKIPLTENPLADSKSVKKYIKQLKKAVKDRHLDGYYGWYLVTTYGTQAESILKKMDDFGKDAPERALLRAETWFGIHHEMVNKADDLLVRRTGRLYFDIHSIEPHLDAILTDMANHLVWDDKRIAKERERMDLLLKDARTFYEVEAEIS